MCVSQEDKETKADVAKEEADATKEKANEENKDEGEVGFLSLLSLLLVCGLFVHAPMFACECPCLQGEPATKEINTQTDPFLLVPLFAPLVPVQEEGVVAGMLGRLALQFPPFVTPKSPEWSRFLTLVAENWATYKNGMWPQRIGEWVPCMNGAPAPKCLKMYQVDETSFYQTSGELKKGCPECRKYKGANMKKHKEKKADQAQ